MVKSKFVAFSDHHIFTLQNTSMELVLADPKQYFDNEKVCYQQIWQSYWYAKYGEFTVVIHKAVGYVNVTQLCKTYKKHFYHWSANKNVKALIAGLAEKLTLNGCPVTTEQMLIVIKGGYGAVQGSRKRNICTPNLVATHCFMAGPFVCWRCKHHDKQFLRIANKDREFGVNLAR